MKRFGLTSTSWLSKNMPVVVNCAVGLVVLSATASIYTYAVIPHAKQTSRQATIQELDINSQQRQAVLQLKAGVQLNKYVEITQDNLSKYFEVVQVPKQFSVNKPVGDPNSIIGKVTTRNFQEHDQVSQSDLISKKDWFGEYDRMKEYDIYNTVGGQIAAGNIVDVIINYGDGNYDVVMAKKKIKTIKFRGAVASDGSAPLDNNLTPTSVMVFDVDETEYADLEAAKKKGKLEVRIYLDETQPTSAVTFQNPGRKHSTPEGAKQDATANGATSSANPSPSPAATTPASGYQIKTGN